MLLVVKVKDLTGLMCIIDEDKVNEFGWNPLLPVEELR